MREIRWQGFPATVQRGDHIAIYLRWRSPRLLQYRGSLFRFLFILSLGFLLYGFLSGGLSLLDPILIGAAFLTYLAALWAGLTACTWRSRVIVFSPHWISCRVRLDNLRLQRALSHGFRLQPFHLPLQGQHPQQSMHAAMMNQQNYYLYLDHPEQSVVLAEIHGAKHAELLCRRLTNISAFMKRKFEHHEGMGEQQSEDSPRGTFTKRRA